MAKLVVMNEEDPGIGIVLGESDPPDKWAGQCTQCGDLIQAYGIFLAFRRAQQHVDAHPARI